MRRWIAIPWHASFLVLAAGAYFFFVLPRWYELTGEWPNTLGTVMRIVCGVLIGLAALPVAFTWLRTRKPEYGTPQLALNLRVASVALHVLAGVLIVGAAISEIWLSLADVGQWLFGIYGAAAAIALLGALGFYLAFVAEMPPPPPKPIKLKQQTRRRGRRKSATDDATDAEQADGATDADGADETEVTEEVTADEAEATDEVSEADEVDDTVEAEPPANEGDAEGDKPLDAGETAGKLRNRRSSGKSLFRRSRGDVAVED